MSQADVVYVKHARDAAQKALEFVKDRKRGDLDLDEMLALSLVQLLQIIGEAANLVSREYISKHPGVPWKKMVGMRNRLIHGYFNVNLDIVWDTVVKDLPNLVKELQKIVDES